MLAYCRLNSWEEISVKSGFYHFLSRKSIWNCHLPKWRPFCAGGDGLNGKNPHICKDSFLDDCWVLLTVVSLYWASHGMFSTYNQYRPLYKYLTSIEYHRECDFLGKIWNRYQYYWKVLENDLNEQTTTTTCHYSEWHLLPTCEIQVDGIAFECISNGDYIMYCFGNETYDDVTCETYML